MALDLSRVFAYVAGHGSVKVRKDGLLSTPALRAMEKAIPLDTGSDLRLPDPHGFYCELLRQLGAVRIQGGEASSPIPRGDAGSSPVQRVAGASSGRAAGCRLAIGSTVMGTPQVSEREDYAASVRTGRQVLAWALGCLARAGDHWYDLTAFLETVYVNLRHAHPHLPAPGRWRGNRGCPPPRSRADGRRSPAGVVVRSTEECGTPTP